MSATHRENDVDRAPCAQQTDARHAVAIRTGPLAGPLRNAAPDALDERRSPSPEMVEDAWLATMMGGNQSGAQAQGLTRDSARPGHFSQNLHPGAAPYVPTNPFIVGGGQAGEFSNFGATGLNDGVVEPWRAGNGVEQDSWAAAGAAAPESHTNEKDPSPRRMITSAVVKDTTGAYPVAGDVTRSSSSPATPAPSPVIGGPGVPGATLAVPRSRRARGKAASGKNQLRSTESEEAQGIATLRETAEADETFVKAFAVVEFKRKRMRKFDAPIETQTGQYVMVDGDRGQDCGLVVQVTKERARGSSHVLNMHADNPSTHPSPQMKVEPGRVLRPATELEIDQLLNTIGNEEQDALNRCVEVVREKGIPIDVVDCEMQFDRKKISFFFDSPESIDFRDLVKDLFRQFNARIWMENINPKVKNVVPKGALSQQQKIQAHQEAAQLSSVDISRPVGLPSARPPASVAPPANTRTPQSQPPGSNFSQGAFSRHYARGRGGGRTGEYNEWGVTGGQGFGHSGVDPYRYMNQGFGSFAGGANQCHQDGYRPLSEKTPFGTHPASESYGDGESLLPRNLGVGGKR